MSDRFSFKKKQAGTALITVVLIAAVVIVMVVESVKTIQYQKQLSSNLINRDQAYSYLMGMEELAKIYLKKAFENTDEDTVHLGQLWAQDDITFPLDGGGMTASIRDMQSCFNLNSILNTSSNSGRNEENNRGGELQGPSTNLTEANRSPTPPSAGNNGEVSGQQVFEGLVDKVKPDTSVIGKDLAASLKDWMDDDIEPTGAEGAEDDYYQGLEIPYRTANSAIAHESELLTMKGFNRNIYFALKPYICVLPKEVNKVNVNTVTEESSPILHAIINRSSGADSRSISESDIKKAISERPEDGYESVGQFLSAVGLGEDRNSQQSNLAVTSEYFEMKAKAEIGKTRVEMRTIFKRNEDNSFSVSSRYFGRE